MVKHKARLLCSLLFILVVSGCAHNQLQSTDQSLQSIKEKGRLVVGTYPVVEPMTFINQSGEVTGFDMDIVRQIASKIGVAIEIKQINFQDLIPSAKKGDIDLIACVLTITPARSEEVLFSIPYFNTGQMIITRKENNNIHGPADLKDKRVGVQKGTTAETAALEYVNQSLLVLYDDWTLAPEDLKGGKTDAILFDVGAYILVQHNAELKIVGEPLTQEFYGFATQKNNNALIAEVNSILREMKRSGELKELENKWGIR